MKSLIDRWYSLGYQPLFRKGASALLSPLGTGLERVAEIKPTIERLAQNFTYTLAPEDL